MLNTIIAKVSDNFKKTYFSKGIYFKHAYGCIAAHAENLSLEERKYLISISDEPEYWAGEVAVYAFGLSLEERKFLLSQLSCDLEKHFGRMATYSDNLSSLEREALILSSDKPDYWYAKAAVHAKNLSFEERKTFISKSHSPYYWLERVAIYAKNLSIKERIELLKEKEKTLTGIEKEGFSFRIKGFLISDLFSQEEKEALKKEFLIGE